MPDISKIQLPGSGGVYNIKDAVAREMISGGVSFVVGWNGSGEPDVTQIPAGVTVTYDNQQYIGTLLPADAQAGAFSLVRSSTSAGVQDSYDEYVVVKPSEDSSTWSWEKIGDTQVDLSDVVTDVGLTKQTDTVIGSDATFSITQPTISLSSESSSATGRQKYISELNTTKLSASASGAAVTPSTTYIKGTASNGGAAWNNKDSATAVTGYPNTTTDTFVKSVSAETGKNLVTTSITPTNGTETVSKVTQTASKLVTTTVPNVTGNTSVTIPNVTGNTSVSASKINSNSSVTANKSTWTFTMGQTSADAETLIIGGGNGSDVTATNTAYSDVTATNTTLGNALTATNTTLGTAKTVATGAVDSAGSGSAIVTSVSISDKTVAKAGTAITVATGETDENGTGDPVVTGVTVGSSAAALTGLGSPSTKSVIGANSTFTNTQPNITIATDTTSGTGKVQVVTNISSVTNPTITISNGDSGDVTIVNGGTTKYMGATASGANTTWNSKDSVTVLKDTTDISVTKGNE